MTRCCTLSGTLSGILSHSFDAYWMYIGLVFVHLSTVMHLVCLPVLSTKWIRSIRLVMSLSISLY